MSDTVTILRYEDIAPADNPTGESLLSRTEPPFKTWIPEANYLVLGSSQEAAKEINLTAALQAKVPIYKRRSGGGAVLLSPGCLCVGLRFQKRPTFSIQDYFRLGSGTIARSISKAGGITVESRGISDLVVENRKVAGCALYMPRDFVLYLISILVQPNFSEIGKYLAHPSKEPDYRLGRSHAEFLAGIGDLTHGKIKAEELLLSCQVDIRSDLGEYLDWENEKGA